LYVSLSYTKPTYTRRIGIKKQYIIRLIKIEKKHLQIIKRTFYLLQTFHTHVRINLGGPAAAVSQQFLDIPKVSAALQQMRRVAVPKPVQCHRFSDLCFFQSQFQNALQTLLTVLFSRTLSLKKPRLWPVRFVILPQQFQYFSRKRRNHVFATFRLPDEHHVPLRIYILWFQVKQLTPPQTAAVDKAQHRF